MLVITFMITLTGKEFTGVQNVYGSTESVRGEQKMDEVTKSAQGKINCTGKHKA